MISVRSLRYYRRYSTSFSSFAMSSVPIQTLRIRVREDLPPGKSELELDVFGDQTAKMPVVLLHGGGQTRHSWARTAVKLARSGYCAIAVDSRGHGNSFWDPAGDYSYESCANDWVALVSSDLLKDKKPVFVGASHGGLTIMAAGSRITNIAAAVFVDIVPRMQTDGVQRIREFMIETMEKGFSTLDEAVDSIQSYNSQRQRSRNVEGLQKNLRKREDGRYYWHWDPKFMKRDNPDQIEQYSFEKYNEINSRLLTQSAKQIKAPILIIRGQSTDVVSQADALAFAQEVNGEFVDVAGAAHMVVGDSNDAFTDALINFINRVSHLSHQKSLL